MARLDNEQIAHVADFLKTLPSHKEAPNFYSFGEGEQEVVADSMYPPLHHPEAINFFFFVCLHQFGFWYGDHVGYSEPLVGKIDGKESKGSDLLWKICMRALNAEPTVFQPGSLYAMKPRRLAQNIFVDDNGPVPFPDIEKRIQTTKEYARWFINSQTTPGTLVFKSNKEKHPLRVFLTYMAKIDGFKEDHLQKKALLLTFILANRPDRLLVADNPEIWRPIVDYHLMRVALRLGLIELRDDEEESNKLRYWVDQETEEHIRLTCYDAILRLAEKSQKSMGALDFLLWSARRYCPEMQDPDCEKCVFTDVCKKRVELFQPVFRTTAY